MKVIKAGSQLAKYGRSKEKRSDAKLVLLAMVINIEGFIKYSAIHEENYADTADINSFVGFRLVILKQRTLKKIFLCESLLRQGEK